MVKEVVVKMEEMKVKEEREEEVMEEVKEVVKENTNHLMHSHFLCE